MGGEQNGIVVKERKKKKKEERKEGVDKQIERKKRGN